MIEINSIEWHEKNLKNKIKCLIEEVIIEKQQTEKVRKLNHQCNLYCYQILSAKKEGKTKFDASKYKKVRVTK